MGKTFSFNFVLGISLLALGASSPASASRLSECVAGILSPRLDWPTRWSLFQANLKANPERETELLEWAREHWRSLTKREIWSIAKVLRDPKERAVLMTGLYKRESYPRGGWHTPTVDIGVERIIALASLCPKTDEAYLLIRDYLKAFGRRKRLHDFARLLAIVDFPQRGLSFLHRLSVTQIPSEEAARFAESLPPSTAPDFDSRVWILASYFTLARVQPLSIERNFEVLNHIAPKNRYRTVQLTLHATRQLRGVFPKNFFVAALMAVPGTFEHQEWIEAYITAPETPVSQALVDEIRERVPRLDFRSQNMLTEALNDGLVTAKPAPIEMINK